MRIPMQLVAMDALGTVLAGVGIAGLVTDLSGLLPFLANRDVAGMIAGVGCALLTYAMIRIVQILRAPTQGPAK